MTADLHPNARKQIEADTKTVVAFIKAEVDIGTPHYRAALWQRIAEHCIVEAAAVRVLEGVDQ